MLLHGSLIICLFLPCSYQLEQANEAPRSISIAYDDARQHELKPHRRTIPIEGAGHGFNQLRLTLLVSETGDTVKAEASGGDAEMALWPAIQGEVERWRFTPFKENGRPVKAEVEEYVDLVPPERLPKVHVVPPPLKPDSIIKITLARSGCFGTCPAYSVSVETNHISFDGRYFVVAEGKHGDAADPDEVRALAKRFIEANFYSMDDSYRASVTDNPTYNLTISIDGRTKSIEDYVGSWEGMPSIISDLEDQVDELAQTERWINGSAGLVDSLKAEGFDFHSFEAQQMLKAAAKNGETITVQEFLSAGVPLIPMAKPKQKTEVAAFQVDTGGWLASASSHREVLGVLISAGASKSDQTDKDLALVGAAQSGDVSAIRGLIAYGANPNADLSKVTVVESSGGMTLSGPGTGSVLIYAAQSGEPEVVREILKYHPKLEARDQEGKTAIFAAGDSRGSDKDGARVECIRLLVKAGANVNAKDNKGNTPLHETFLTDVEEELLKSGADVNARNDDGETPIFTTVDDDAIPLFIQYGADLSIRNKKGETVVQAAESKGPLRQEALRKAMQAASN